MVIYADLIFIINFASNYMMLLLLGRIIPRSASLARLLFASAAGAAGTAVIFCISIPDIFLLLLKICLCAAMVILAYGMQGAEFLRLTAIFIFLLYSFSGLTLCIVSVLRKNTLTLIRNGIIYFDLPDGVFFAAVFTAYISALIIFKVIRRRKNILPIKIILRQNCAATLALYDSGNLLKDPLSGKSVIIAEWDAVKSLFGFEYNELFSHPDKYPVTVIPYQSLGNPRGIIPAFTADYVRLENRVIKKAVIGISKDMLCKNNNYHALIGNGLL